MSARMRACARIAAFDPGRSTTRECAAERRPALAVTCDADFCREDEAAAALFPFADLPDLTDLSDLVELAACEWARLCLRTGAADPGNAKTVRLKASKTNNAMGDVLRIIIRTTEVRGKS